MDFEDETDKIIGQQIIGSIDEDGYLRCEPIAITDDLLFSSNMSISEEQVVKVLTVIQGFDPKGVGARTLQEALLIQIRSKLNNTSELDEYKLKDLQAAEIILRDYFNEFSKKHFSKLVQNLEIDEDDLKAGSTGTSGF